MKLIEIKRVYDAPSSEVIEFAATSVVAASLVAGGEDAIDGGEW